jgi:hypothetical protein
MSDRSAEVIPESVSRVFAVPLIIENPGTPAVSHPFAVGVPFPRGLLTDAAQVALLDSTGNRVAVQAIPLATWIGGSIKWLLLDFVARSLPAGTSQWRLVPAESVPPSAGTLRVRESTEAIVVETGKATFHIDRRILLPFAKVATNGAAITQFSRVVLTDAKGEAGIPRVERTLIETRGPVRATVRLEGTWDGRVLSRFLARLCFFADSGLVRLRLRIHNPNRAKHPGGLWDLGDPGSMFFRDLSLEIGVAENEPAVSWATEPGQPSESTTGDLEIYQDSSGGENWQNKNHVNRDDRVPVSFRGYRICAGAQKRFGLRASPTVTAGDVAVAVPEFWQQFPKAVEVEKRCLRVRMFPQQFGDLFELQGGERKTHTVWLQFGSERKLQMPLRWVHQPASIHAAPEWYADSGACGCLPFAPRPRESGNRLDAYLKPVVEGPQSLLARREVIDEYGWRNFGDMYADHEEAYYQGPLPIISHFNNQYDVVQGALVQYLRTGDHRWFALADPLARHVMDIDIYHTDKDKAQYNGGLFWFSDHYKDASTSTHRTYSRKNCVPRDRSYGGGPSSNHNFTTGLLYYYFLTGDPDARDAVIGLADWVTNMDDGRSTVLGLIDDGPTGAASCTGTPNYHGPGRGSGNSITALLDAWILSGRCSYLDGAEALIRRTVHPTDDIAALDLLNVEKRWSYPVFFVALSRYLDLKFQAGELDYMYAYSRASLLHYARWMADNERPYFDHPEQLEYPTEAWAAQEFRKANVLRLAAAHAEEPWRGRFVKRGEELAERAWSDLLRFDSRYVTRAIALVLSLGTVDDYLRCLPPGAAPPGARTHDFGAPQRFVSQKQRVLAQLKTFRGLVRATWRVVNPHRWLRSSR